ncbi:hypothetical protein DP113_27985 [Brasilonema octagenarum UFV-E1]|uniref:Uncharacterized protein n=1 Tax=Brasilonema sennae CENA114 TaxID=415709 RepID=A0A856ML15_9CYAN|nr:hypothetical protein DP114_28055 [Brasilonema sennae CENA114]QDL17577.1 hypothetical protein DP113_27985 [Brasilonema octagenarum UFV-E1]
MSLWDLQSSVSAGDTRRASVQGTAKAHRHVSASARPEGERAACPLGTQWLPAVFGRKEKKQKKRMMFISYLGRL